MKDLGDVVEYNYEDPLVRSIDLVIGWSQTFGVLV